MPSGDSLKTVPGVVTSARSDPPACRSVESVRSPNLRRVELDPGPPATSDGSSDAHNARDPQAPSLKVWHHVLLTGVIYECAAIPFILTFLPSLPLQESPAVGVFYAWELLFLLDIYVKLTTGFYQDGNLICDPQKSRKKYLTSTEFLVDALAIVPYATLPVQLSLSKIVLELPKLLRVHSIPRYLSDVDDVFVRHFEFLKLGKLLVGVVLLSHFIACMRFSFGYDDHHNNHWLPPLPVDQATAHSQYLMSMFWAFGLLTGLFEGELPHTVNEFLFTILVAICGFSIFTYLCATFFMLSSCEATHAEASEARITQIKHILTFHRVPEEVRGPIIEYLRNYYASADTSDREVMKLLCPPIAKDVQVELMKDVVATIPVFASCDPQFIVALTALLERISLPARCKLFGLGDFGDAMYIIHSGVLDVIGSKAKIRELRKNDFVGELSLFSSHPRSATVVTATYCVLYQLSRVHTELVLASHPGAAGKIRSAVAAIIEKTHILQPPEPKTASINCRPPVKRRMSSGWIELRQATPPGALRRLTLGLKRNSVVTPAAAEPATGSFYTQSGKAKQLSADVQQPLRPPRLLQRVLSMKKRRVSDAMKDVYDQYTRPRHANAPKPWWTALLLQECLDSSSPCRLGWIVCLQAILLFNWCLIPLQLSFPVFANADWLIYLLNGLADAVLWVDLYLNFNWSYTHASEKIRDPMKSAARYLRGSFALDLLCVLPYDAFVPATQYCVARIPRLLRVWGIHGHFHEVDTMYPLRSKQRLVLYGVLLFLLIHIETCLFFSVTLWEGFSSGEGWLPSNDVELRRIDATHFAGHDNATYTLGEPALERIATTQYLRSFYYATHVLTALGKGVEPESDAEYIVALMFMFSGFFITAIVVDNVQKRFTASAHEEKEFFAVRARIQGFLRRQNAPFAIHHRVNLFLDFWWASHRGAKLEELLRDFPVGYKREVLRSICQPVLRTLSLLAGVRPALKVLEEALVDNAKFILYGQGELLYREGDNVHGLYFLLEGSVSLSTTGIPSKVPRGGCFGMQRHHRNVEQVGYMENAVAASGCVVLFLSRPALEKINDVFPSLTAELAALETRLLRTKLSRSSLESVQDINRSSGNSRWIADLFSCQTSSIDPDSKAAIAWETWLFLVMTAQWIRVLLHICFGVLPQHYAVEDGITVALETLFAVDIYIRSRLGYREFGNKILELQLIRRRYFRSWHFLIDVVAVLPLFMINWLPSAGRWELFNLNKAVRLLKVPNQFRALEQRYLTFTSELRLMKLLYYTFLSSHVLGCIYFDFASHQSGIHVLIAGDTEPTNFGGDNWEPPKSLEHASMAHQYFASNFWAFGIMSASNTGELPQTTSQCVFTIITLTTGFFLFAYVIGNFSDMIELNNAEHREFNAKLGSVRRLLAHFALPAALESKVKMYFFFKRFHSITQEAVLERYLPPSLMTDIRLLSLRVVIEKAPFLGKMDAPITRMLVSQFVQVLVLKDDYVYQYGDDGTDMFFVFAGILAVLVPRSQQKKTEASWRGPVNRIENGPLDPLQKVSDISAGDFFGENALFSDTPRNSFVRSKTSCILYSLSRHSLNMVFELFPDWRNRVLQSVKVQQKQQKLLGHSSSHLLRADTSSSPLAAPQSREAIPSATKRLALVHRDTWRRALGWVRAMRTGIEAQSPLHITWLRIVTASTFYVAFMIPSCVAFEACRQWEGLSLGANSLEVVCFALFLMDIWINTRLKETALSTELYEVNLRDTYRRERLLVDIIAALPVQYLLFLLTSSMDGAWLRANRCVKVLNVAHYMQEIHRQNVSYEWARLQTILLLYALAIYWSACAYLLFADYEGYGTEWNAWFPSTAVELDNDSPLSVTFLRLLRGAFFAVTVFVKKGRTFTPEGRGYVFALVLCFVGLLVLAFMIGEIASLFISSIDNEVHYRKHHIAVEHSLARWKVSATLNRRVQAFLSMLWSSHRGVLYQEVFEYLPPKIRQETVLHIADLPLQALIFKVFRPLVQGDAPSLTRLTRSIADCLRFNSYPRGECVLTEGMMPEGLFFVVTGQLVATSRRRGPEKLLARYTRGDYFGERGILTHSVSEISVRTQVECDLLSLSADSLAAVLRADDFFAIVLSTIEDLFRELRQDRSQDSSRLFPMALNVWDQLLRHTLQQQRKQWAMRSSAAPPLKSEALWSSVLTGVLDTNDAPFSCVQLFRSFVEMVGPQGELFERTAAVQRRESILVVSAKSQHRQRIRTLVRHIGAVAVSSTSRVTPLLLRKSSSSRRLERSAGRMFTEASRRPREAPDEN